MKIKININSIIFYILTFLIVYMSGSTATALISGNSLQRFIGIIISGIGLVYLMISINNRVWMRYITVAAMLTVSYGIISYLRYAGSYSHMLLRIIWFIVFIAINFYMQEKQYDFLKYVNNIIFILAVIALILFVLTTVWGKTIPHSTINSGTIVYSNYWSIYYVANVYYIDLFGFKLYRLQSLFWEPGVFAVFLNYALYYFIFKKEEKKSWQLIILILALVLTVSTTGIIIGIAMLAIYIIRSPHLRRIKWLSGTLIAAVAVLAIAYVWMQKRAESNFQMMSYSLRMQDLILGFKIFLNNPVLGTGYNNTLIFTNLQGYGRGNSNGLITWLFTMGMVGTVIMFYPFIAYIRKQNDRKKRFDECIYLALFIGINMTEPLQYSSFVIFMIVAEYVKYWRLRWRRDL